MNLKKIALASLASLIFAACSDSSSTSAENPTTDPTQESANNPVQDTTTTPAEGTPAEGTPTETTPNAPASTVTPAVPLTEADYDSVGVVDLGRALQSVASDEKVVIVLRHGERESMSGHESPLTPNGILQSQQVGQKIPASMKLTYHHTDYVRTEQTALNIALGHGQDTVGLAHDTVNIVKGSWFVKDADLKDSYATKDTNSYGVLSLWVYEGLFADAFYDLNEKGKEMIDSLISDYAVMEPAKLIISHDDFVMPMMAYVSNKKADFRYKRALRWWVNYLVGFVVVVNSNNEVRSIPVKGLDSAVE